MLCIICRFDTELDDVVVRSGAQCVCLRCYYRETGDTRQMTKKLQREISAVLAGVQVV